MSASRRKLLASFAVSAGIVLVGWIDFATGTEVRILALYFLPLLLAGWELGVAGAVIASVCSTATWLLVMSATGVQFSRPYVWAFNGLTEGLGFLTVSLLVARLREALVKEISLGRLDSLTGLANRRSFVDLASLGLTLSQRHGRPASLAYLDLDNFKQVNDTFGHHRGDDLLRQCARILRDCVRESDTVARLGGDEFAIFLPETGFESARALMDRVRAAIDGAADFQSMGVTASIGIISEVEVSSGIETLLNQADAQMYAAKRQGAAGNVRKSPAQPEGG